MSHESYTIKEWWSSRPCSDVKFMRRSFLWFVFLQYWIGKVKRGHESKRKGKEVVMNQNWTCVMAQWCGIQAFKCFSRLDCCHRVGIPNLYKLTQKKLLLRNVTLWSPMILIFFCVEDTLILSWKCLPVYLINCFKKYIFCIFTIACIQIDEFFTMCQFVLELKNILISCWYIN